MMVVGLLHGLVVVMVVWVITWVGGCDGGWVITWVGGCDGGLGYYMGWWL